MSLPSLQRLLPPALALGLLAAPLAAGDQLVVLRVFDAEDNQTRLEVLNRSTGTQTVLSSASASVVSSLASENGDAVAFVERDLDTDEDSIALARLPGGESTIIPLPEEAWPFIVGVDPTGRYATLVETPTSFLTTLYVADGRTGELHVLSGFGDEPWLLVDAPSIRFGPRGRFLTLVATTDLLERTAYLYDLENDELIDAGALVDPVGETTYAEFGPAGRALYLDRGDGVGGPATDLFALDLRTRETTRLNEPAQPAAQVFSSITVSPRGRWLAYSSDEETDGVFELFGVDLRTGARRKLSPPLGADDGVFPLPSFPASNEIAEFTEDESAVLFFVRRGDSGVSELYRADLRGGLPTNLSEATGLTGILSLELDPAGRFLALRVNSPQADSISLYLHDFASGATRQLSPDGSDGGVIGANFAFSANGRALVYTWSPGDGSGREIYHLDLRSDLTTRVNEPLAAPLPASAFFALSRGGREVLYAGTLESPTASQLAARDVLTGVHQVLTTEGSTVAIEVVKD